MADNFSIQAITTDDGSLTLRHKLHGECYHSSQGARFEAEQLYMERSGFAASLLAGSEGQLTILDVGLGLGYNACTGIERWWQTATPPSLTLVSLENDAELFEALRSGSAAWQEGWPELWLKWVSENSWVSEINKSWVSEIKRWVSGIWVAEIRHPRSAAKLRWEVYIGEAQKLIREVGTRHSWDFVWQDAFSPKHCPELWSQQWFSDLRAGSKESTVLVTYSVSRMVRDNLAAAGWKPQKIPCPGPKREWLRAQP